MRSCRRPALPKWWISRSSCPRARIARRLVDGAKAGEFELCASEVLLAELQGVLSRGKFAAPLAQAGLTPEGIASDLRRLAVAVSPASVPRVVPTDPDDDHVLAAALTGAADVIDSGDKRDLLPLGSDQGIPIVMTREALVRLEAQCSGSGLETGGLTLALTLAPHVRGVVAIE